MTVADTTPRIERYDGNDSATNFAFPHKFYADTDLVVTHKTSAGVVTLPVLDTDYTVTGEGTDSSGSVEFPIGGSAYSTLASGSPAERLTIISELPTAEITDLDGSFQFSTLNLSKDKVMVKIQEVEEMLSRAILQTVSNSDEVPTVEEVLTGMATLALSALDAKTVLIAADIMLIGDSADSFSNKKATLTNLMTFIATLHYLKSEHVDSSAGGADAGKPIKLDGAGQIALNMLKAATTSAKGIQENAIASEIDNNAASLTVTAAQLILSKYGGALQDNAIVTIIGAGGAAIVAGLTQARWIAPCAGTFTKATALLDQSGSIVIDIWKDTYGNYPPTNAESITNSNELTISGAIKGQDDDLTDGGSDWVINFVKDDIFFFYIDSAGTATSATIDLQYNRTGV